MNIYFWGAIEFRLEKFSRCRRFSLCYRHQRSQGWWSIQWFLSFRLSNSNRSIDFDWILFFLCQNRLCSMTRKKEKHWRSFDLTVLSIEPSRCGSVPLSFLCKSILDLIKIRQKPVVVRRKKKFDLIRTFFFLFHFHFSLTWRRTSLSQNRFILIDSVTNLSRLMRTLFSLFFSLVSPPVSISRFSCSVLQQQLCFLIILIKQTLGSNSIFFLSSENERKHWRSMKFSFFFTRYDY